MIKINFIIMLKTLVTLIVGVIFFTKTATSQLPCNRLPTSDSLLKLLSEKPITNIERINFMQDCNVNDSTIKRLIYLLHWEWTKYEIEGFLNNEIKKNWSFYKIEERARIVSNENDSLYKLALDSLTQFFKSENLKNLIKYNGFKVDNSLILTSAYLDIVDAIPILKKGLSDSIHYSRPYVELALARFGDINLQKKIIRETEYKKELNGKEWIAYFYQSAGKLIFISTQESIFQLYNWLDTSKRYASKSDGVIDSKNAYYVIIILKNAIKNSDFQLLVKDVDSPYNKMDNSIILACKNWLIKNKGKYKINRNWSPY